MVLLRAIGIVLLVAVAVCALLFLLSGDRRYLRWAGNLLKILAVLGLIFFGVLLVDRAL
ncbi:MAG: hypothetical protein JSW68_05615 [Burkholderiales bacterium]|nr:MAG: hypothetical protein JSW68_05615 [Burkholderiales bacterium]